MLGQVFERFVQRSPLSVMVRGTLERVLEPINSINSMTGQRPISILASCYFPPCMT